MNISQRVALKMLRNDLIKIQQNIGKIESNCKHKLIQFGATPKFKHEGSAKCEDCDRFFGWWCPNSPDKMCHYQTYEIQGFLLNARAVELVDGTEHIIYNYDVNPEYENDDDCLFCHEPDERK